MEVVDATLSHAEMRALYLESALFVKNANREGWSVPCSEAVACRTPVAATDIPVLRSHLPSTTRWFPVGDWRLLSAHLVDRYRRFSVELQQSHLYTDALMCRLVSEGLEQHLGGMRPG